MVTMRGWNVTRQHVLWFAGQAGLVLLGVYLYFRIRNLTEGNAHVAHENAEDIVELQKRIGLDLEGELQAPVAQSDTLQAFANWIYIWGHWPVIVVTMAWLAWRHMDVFRRLRDGMLISGAIGMVIFALYPVAPPRLANLGLVDTVTETSSSYRVLQPPGFTNQYAAMPSLHIGWDLLVGIAIVTAGSTLLVRAIGYAMPILMAWAVVSTANHYVLDVVAGIALVLVAHWLALRLERRRYGRQEAEAMQSSGRQATGDGSRSQSERPRAARRQATGQPPTKRTAESTALPPHAHDDDGQPPATSPRSTSATPSGHRPPRW